MAVPTADPLAEAQAALQAADWVRAKAGFEEVLGEREQPEALDGLGKALWWHRDLEGCLRLRERAYVLFREAGNYRRAAFIAVFLAREQLTLYGNQAACQGWLARAAGLLEHEDATCVERGWLEKARAFFADNPIEKERHARAALAIARQCRDADLEAVALAHLGVALVKASQVADGMRCLDEALVGVTAGEVRELWTMAESYCLMLEACVRIDDLRRAEEWMQVVDGFAIRTANQVAFGLCRTFQGMIFARTGRWDEAERVLTEALKTWAGGYRAMGVFSALALADLRLRQGRLEEAAHLTNGLQNAPFAAGVIGALQLQQGDAETAAATAERRVRQLPASSLDAAPLLALLVEAHIARGDPLAAGTALGSLQELAQAASLVSVEALSELSGGRLAVLRGDQIAADHLERALELYQQLGMPLEHARVRMELARLHATDRPAAAIKDARAALAAFEELGASADIDAAAQVLRRLGVNARTGPKGYGALTRREYEVLALLQSGLSNPEIAARLFLSRRTVEHHVSTILAKLEVRNRAEAVALPQRQGIPIEK